MGLILLSWGGGGGGGRGEYFGGGGSVVWWGWAAVRGRPAMRIVPVLLNDRETKPTSPPISNQWQSILARVIVVRQSGLRRIKSPSIATVPSQLATLDTQISLSFAAMLFLTLVFGSWWSLLTKSESLVASQSWLYSIFDNSKKVVVYVEIRWPIPGSSQSWQIVCFMLFSHIYTKIRIELGRRNFHCMKSKWTTSWQLSFHCCKMSFLVQCWNGISCSIRTLNLS